MSFPIRDELRGSASSARRVVIGLPIIGHAGDIAGIRQRVLAGDLTHPVILDARHCRRIPVVVGQLFGVFVTVKELAELAASPARNFRKFSQMSS